MQSEDARYLKRKVKSGAIDVHPTEKALVVNYELEAVILGELGDPMHGDKKECQKIIRLNNLTSKTDCAALAKDVIEKCSLIHPSKLDEVEQLIYYLKHRKRSTSKLSLTTSNSKQSLNSLSRPQSTVTNTEAVSINNIDEYVELLYEDVPQKIKGSQFILELAKNPDNLEELSKNEAALSALTRVLREDWKKNIDLSTNILCTLFFFSSYIDFHPVIIQYKIGSLCMYLLQQEFIRYDQWKEELDSLNQERDLMSTSASEMKKSRIPEPTTRRPRSGIFNIPESALTRAKTASPAISQDSGIDEVISDLNDNKLNNIEKTKKQISVLMKKQDQLLRVIFYLLLNIADDTKIESKMLKKDIIGMLFKALDRRNLELLTLVVTFLKKISFFSTGVNEIEKVNIFDKLPTMLEIGDAELVHVTLKLVYNLSFNDKLRTKLVDNNWLPKLVGYLGDEKHQNVAIKILYIITTDRDNRKLFIELDCVELLMDMVLLCKDSVVDIDLISLCINLAYDRENVEHIVEKNLIPNILRRAFRYKDALVMKMLRNMSRFPFAKIYYMDYVGDIARSIIDNKNEDFALECVGTLGNLNLPNIDFAEIFTRLNLIPWLRNKMMSESTEDDLVLDVIVLLGTAAADKNCAQLLCNEGILVSAVSLLNAKQTDDEIVLQTVFLFYQILWHTATRDHLVKETDAVAYMIDLLRDKNKIIRKWCNKCLDVVAFADIEWSARIKIERFRAHNAQWLDMVEGHDFDTLEFNEIKPEPMRFVDSDFFDKNLSYAEEKIAELEIDFEDKLFEDREKD